MRRVREKERETERQRAESQREAAKRTWFNGGGGGDNPTQSNATPPDGRERREGEGREERERDGRAFGGPRAAALADGSSPRHPAVPFRRPPTARLARRARARDVWHARERVSREGRGGFGDGRAAGARSAAQRGGRRKIAGGGGGLGGRPYTLPPDQRPPPAPPAGGA
jgi:hypothetical protein